MRAGESRDGATLRAWLERLRYQEDYCEHGKRTERRREVELRDLEDVDAWDADDPAKRRERARYEGAERDEHRRWLRGPRVHARVLLTHQYSERLAPSR